MGIPTASVAAQKEARIQMAATFLVHPAAKGGKWSQQLNFLLSKGLSQDEADEARRRYENGEAGSWPIVPLPVQKPTSTTSTVESMNSKVLSAISSGQSTERSHTLRASDELQSSSKGQAPNARCFPGSTLRNVGEPIVELDLDDD